MVEFERRWFMDAGHTYLARGAELNFTSAAKPKMRNPNLRTKGTSNFFCFGRGSL